MAIVIMAVGVVATLLFRVDEQGVVLLDAVESGLPKFHMFQFAGIDWTQAAGRSLMIAAVIMSETLLTENNFALKNGIRLMRIKKFWPGCNGKSCGCVCGLLPGKWKYFKNFNE